MIKNVLYKNVGPVKKLKTYTITFDVSFYIYIAALYSDTWFLVKHHN